MISLRKSFGGWPNLDEFLSKSGLQRVDLTALAAAGAFSGFQLERRPALWLAEKGPQTGFINPPDSRLHFPAEDPLKAVHQDFKSMMTSLRDHPTRLIRRVLLVLQLSREPVDPRKGYSHHEGSSLTDRVRYERCQTITGYGQGHVVHHFGRRFGVPQFGHHPTHLQKIQPNHREPRVFVYLGHVTKGPRGLFHHGESGA